MDYSQDPKIESYFSELTKSLQPFLGEFNRIQEIISPIIKQQQEFAELVKRVMEQSVSERNAMLESGWWFTPSLMEVPAYYLAETAEEYNAGNKLAVINLFKKVYQENNCENLKSVVLNWEKNPLFSPWKQHLEDALDAHKNGKYTLSIPVLLLIAEGIATDFCKKEEIYNKADASRGGEKIKTALNKYYTETGHFLLSDLNLLEEAINTTIYQNTNLIEERLLSNILNRHAVLHGSKKDYGTVEASLKAFMLLDVLSDLK